MAAAGDMCTRELISRLVTAGKLSNEAGHSSKRSVQRQSEVGVRRDRSKSVTVLELAICEAPVWFYCSVL